MANILRTQKNTYNDGIYERSDDIKGKDKFVERWLAEVDLAEDVFDDWYDQSEASRNMYRAENEFRDQRYNLHYSNVNTTLPALYANTPKPDVRKRYNDPLSTDEAARIAAQIIERNLVVSMDQYDVDGAYSAFVRDGLISGRGVVRVRYIPRISDEYVFHECRVEPVPWSDFLTGPGQRWEDVTWIAFKHTLTRDQLVALNPKTGNDVPLDFTVENLNDEQAPQRLPNVFKRAEVYEIWDKQSRQIIWVSKSFKDRPISVRDDTMELMDFFPVPKPLMLTETTDTLVPMVPANIIKSLLAELEDITTRIQRLIRVIKWRGFCDPTLNIVELEAANDGELVPAGETIMPLIQAGGLERAIWLMPIDVAVQTVIALDQQRERTKQLVYEVTGISDIIRGQSDANETLGAQEIKANFGTLRLQHMQKMVQRVCRDSLRLVAELMCTHFDIDELMLYAGIKLPTQADKQMQQMQMQQAQMTGQEPPPVDPRQERMMAQPTVEEVKAIIENDLIRTYTIDVETDSTIQQDMRQVQQNMAEFLNGTASFLQAIGPMVAEGVMPEELAVDLYLPFARSFHLGKQAEDALEQMAAKANDPQKPEKPDPAQQQAEMQQQQLQAEMQVEQAKAQAAIQAQQQKDQLATQSKQQQNELDIQKATQLAQIELKKIVDAHQLAMQQKRELDQLDLQTKSASAEIDLDQQQASAVVATASATKQSRMKLDDEHERSEMKRSEMADAAKTKDKAK